MFDINQSNNVIDNHHNIENKFYNNLKKKKSENLIKSKKVTLNNHKINCMCPKC